ncbi:MAG: nucleotidyltransferase domain-containing protein [Verrucomicrobia bacterium]|nr:nucleotidyltransferase domain-containing protein [Verrucomicrobiota bacterium]
MQLRIKDLDVLRAIFRRFPAVREVKLFGSRATSTARRASDIDLAISTPSATPSEWADICDALDNAPIIYDLDILRLDCTTSPALLERIDREGIVIYRQQ